MSTSVYKPTPFRTYDYAYDPVFAVSSEKDRFKAVLLAKMETSKFQVCPVFASMFSDLKNYPRVQLIRRKSAPLLRAGCRSTPVKHMHYAQRPVDVVGFDRAKFFAVPKRNVVFEGVREDELIPRTVQDSPHKLKHGKKANKKQQSVYRENSSQTMPWQPPYKLSGNADADCELLKLDFLAWGSGLPADVHSVQLIERARMKRLWEQKCVVKTEEDLIRQRTIIEAVERNEWAFREQEIQEIQDLRLKLLEQMLKELHENVNERGQKKLRMFAEMKNAEMAEKLKRIAHKSHRAMRKLDQKHAGNTSKYAPSNVVEEHVNRSSEIYAPLMRHGVHPRQWHQAVDDALNRYTESFEGIEEFSTLPTWLARANRIKDCCCLKMQGTRLCMRETKWTAPVLKKLHDELKLFRKVFKPRYSLVQRKVSLQSQCSTPEVECIPDEDEEFYQAMVLIQAMVKGRAAQMHIYEGRERCRELIEELKHTAGLLDEENQKIYEERLSIKLQQRNEQLEKEKIFRLQESLDRLQGSIVGSLLDFLNKELRRLLEERRAHAICLLLERERNDREAAEAGRRQMELRRRREHDEMFKQLVKMEQETVDVYLEDIVKEGMKFASEAEAKQYIKHLAQKIDTEAYKIYTKVNEYSFEGEEQVANLIHHFLLPEVQKEEVRNRLVKKQKEKLRSVHDTVYGEIEDVGVTMMNEESDDADD